MFAVPGWKLPAPIKSETLKDTKSVARKSDITVTPENVADLWSEKVDKIFPVASVAQRFQPSSSSSKKRAHTNAMEGAAKSMSTERLTSTTKRQLPQANNGHNKRRKLLPNQDFAPKTSKANMPVEPPGAGHQPHPAKVVPNPVKTLSTLTPLQDSMRKKLTSARFRHLNQTLYTSASQDARQLFENDSDMFEEYHLGFRQQVATWPQNPVDAFVQELRARSEVSSNIRGKKSGARGPQTQTLALPRTHGICNVADLGCGDANLAKQVAGFGRNTKIKVLSYDLHSPNALVTQADIAHLPLQEGVVDVAIMCLALMGTNWIDFIEEAWRVLHWKGELWIAEIKSRFGPLQRQAAEPNQVKKHKGKRIADAKTQEREDAWSAEEQLEAEARSGKETDVSAFVEVLRRRGFGLQSDGGVDLSNRMFVRMKFIKNGSPSTGKHVKPQTGKEAQPSKRRFNEEGDNGIGRADEDKVLKPCLYKQR